MRTSGIETGLNDFHKMTTFKTTFNKGPSKIIAYPDFKRCSKD